MNSENSADELARVTAERNELLRLARRLVNATTEDEEGAAWWELRQCALGNGYLDIPEPVVAGVLRELREYVARRDALKKLLSLMFERWQSAPEFWKDGLYVGQAIHLSPEEQVLVQEALS